MTDCTCNRGYTGPDGTDCVACLPNQFKNTTGAAACDDCPAHARSPEASDNATDCKCNAGYYGPADVEGPCPGTCSWGGFAPGTGQGSWKGAPYQCYGSDHMSRLSKTSTCYGFDCPYACGLKWGDSCRPCSAGKYKELIGVGSWVPIEEHPYLEYQPGCRACPYGSHSPEASPLATNCTCNKGYTGPGDGRACFACPPGTYKSVTGSAPCDVTAWSLKAIGQSNPFASFNNTLTLTLKSQTHDALAGSTVTITGLAGSATHTSGSLPLTCTGDALGTAGDWNADGTLTLTVAAGKVIVKDVAYTVTFVLLNRADVNANNGMYVHPPVVSIAAMLMDMAPALCSWCLGNITVGTIPKIAKDRPGTNLYDVGNGADPLRIVKPAFSLLKMGQSNPFVFASNQITVTMQSVTHTAPAGSMVTLSGLNGSATASSQAMHISCSDDAMVAAGDWHADGTLEMTVAPGKALVKGSTYVVVFTITNPGNPMASPSVSAGVTVKDSSGSAVGEVEPVEIEKEGADMYGFPGAGDPLQVVLCEACQFLGQDREDLLRVTTRHDEYYYLDGFLPCSFGNCTFYFENDQRAGFPRNATGLLSRVQVNCNGSPETNGVLGLNGKSITGLSSNVFDGMSEVRVLYLSNNALEAVPAGVFDALTGLEELYLHDNRLTTLPAGLFEQLTELRVLSLSNNRLSSLPSGIFAPLTKLKALSLIGNDLTSLPTTGPLEANQLKIYYTENNQLRVVSGAASDQTDPSVGRAWFRSRAAPNGAEKAAETPGQREDTQKPLAAKDEGQKPAGFWRWRRSPRTNSKPAVQSSDL